MGEVSDGSVVTAIILGTWDLLWMICRSWVGIQVRPNLGCMVPLSKSFLNQIIKDRFWNSESKLAVFRSNTIWYRKCFLSYLQYAKMRLLHKHLLFNQQESRLDKLRFVSMMSWNCTLMETWKQMLSVNLAGSGQPYGLLTFLLIPNSLQCACTIRYSNIRPFKFKWYFVKVKGKPSMWYSWCDYLDWYKICS